MQQYQAINPIKSYLIYTLIVQFSVENSETVILLKIDMC